MVLENLFKEKWVERRPSYSFLLGVIFTLIAYATSRILFRHSAALVGVSAILFVVILALPGINRLFDSEERKEAENYGGFVREHEETFDFYIYFFLGVFAVFFALAIMFPSSVLSMSDITGSKASASQQRVYKVSDSAPPGRIPPPPPPDFSLGAEKQKAPFLNAQIFSIFLNNLYVMLVAFALSLFYGSGALFLITFNASVFASALAGFVRARIVLGSIVFSTSIALCHVAVIMLHMVPEVAAYVLAAIAGGVLSKALLREKAGSKRFKRVLKDSFILLLISVAVLFFAAFMEVKVSKGIFSSDICSVSPSLVVGAISAFIALLVFFEVMRKRSKKR